MLDRPSTSTSRDLMSSCSGPRNPRARKLRVAEDGSVPNFVLRKRSKRSLTKGPQGRTSRSRSEERTRLRRQQTNDVGQVLRSGRTISSIFQAPPASLIHSTRTVLRPLRLPASSLTNSLVEMQYSLGSLPK